MPHDEVAEDEGQGRGARRRCVGHGPRQGAGRQGRRRRHVVPLGGAGPPNQRDALEPEVPADRAAAAVPHRVERSARVPRGRHARALRRAEPRDARGRAPRGRQPASRRAYRERDEGHRERHAHVRRRDPGGRAARVREGPPRLLERPELCERTRGGPPHGRRDRGEERRYPRERDEALSRAAHAHLREHRRHRRRVRRRAEERDRHRGGARPRASGLATTRARSSSRAASPRW